MNGNMEHGQLASVGLNGAQIRQTGAWLEHGRVASGGGARGLLGSDFTCENNR